jgi:prepilin-type processing-associated H-X9-DG protein
MSYVGQTLPVDRFSGYLTETFTGDGSTTAFTLTREPHSESAIIVVINNVVQQPVEDYTVSGTTLTIDAAVASGDVIYATHTGGVLPITESATIDLQGVSDALVLDSDADTTISADTDDQIDFKLGGVDEMTMSSTGIVINEGSNDRDFRIESNGNANMLFVDGGNDAVNVGGTTAAGGKLNVETSDDAVSICMVCTSTNASEGPLLLFKRDNNSSADGDLTGSMKFQAENDANQQTVYYELQSAIGDDADGAEDGRLTFYGTVAGTARNILDMTDSNIVFNQDSQDIDFRVESDDFTHALFVEGSSGHVFINQSSNYSDSALQVTESSNDHTIAWFQHDGGSGVNNYGIAVQFRNQAPDNNTVYLQSWQDSSAIRARCWSDGDFQNHDGTYGTLSDERIKQNITAANSQWDDIKALQFKNFKKKDDVAQYGADKAPVHLGLIAQEVESVSPNLVKEYAASELDKDLHSDFSDWENSTIKGIKYSILYMKAVKALQEAQTRIETLETKVAALEG